MGPNEHRAGSFKGASLREPAESALDIAEGGGGSDETPRGWFDQLLRGMGALAGTIILFVMLAVSAEVLARYFAGRPLGWTTEVSEVALLYLTFVAAAWVLRNDGHITVDLISHILSRRNIARLRVLTSVLGAAACGFLVVYGAQVAWSLFARGARSPTLLALPQGPITVIIPLGSLLLTIEFLRRAVRSSRMARNLEE